MIDVLNLDVTEGDLERLNAVHTHEIFAVTLLLCTPSALARAWTDNDSLDKARAELTKLPLSDDMKAFAIKFMSNYSGVKSFFKGIADIHAVVYAGPEPHPSGTEAQAIVRKLRELDPR
jgi:hypothetical protein